MLSTLDEANSLETSHYAFFRRPTGNPAIDADLEYIRNLNWSESSIGPIESWSPELLALINLAILSPQPQLFLLGPDSIILYNTAYGVLLRDHHPLYQGRPIALNSALIANAPAIDRIIDRATTREQPANENRVPFFFLNNGRLEEIFLSATMVQLPQSVQGFHATTYDTTVEAVQARRDHALGYISQRASQADNLPTLWSSILEAISAADQDIPFAVLYCADIQLVRDPQTGFVRRDIDAINFHLEGSVGHFITPPPTQICLETREEWIVKLCKAKTSSTPVLLENAQAILPESFCSAGRHRCHGDDCKEVAILPCILEGGAESYCILTVGLSPRRPYDHGYQSWIRSLNLMLANFIASITVAETRALTRENETLRAARERQVFAKELSLKKQEAALATDKIRRMLSIMQSANVGVFECLPSGQIVESNESFSRLSGSLHNIHEQPEQNIFSVCHTEDTVLLEQYWKSLVFGETLTFAIRFQSVIKTEASSTRWVQLACVPVLNNALKVQTIVGCVTDISAQKAVEENIKRAEAMKQIRLQETRMLEEAIEAKRQQENFVDMTSHEIRNPLSVVVHSVDALAQTLSEMKTILDGASTTAESFVQETQKQNLYAHLQEGSDFVDTIMSCTTHQKRITDDILSLSKLNSDLLEISPTVFNIGDFMAQIYSTFAAEAARARVVLETRSDQSLVDLNIAWAKADPGRIVQVLVNLVSNAIKFTKDNTGTRHVSITVGASRDPSNILDNFVIARSPGLVKDRNTRTMRESFSLWFKVNDTGCGMNEADRIKIFTRFTQASPKTYNAYGGSGLGLFVSVKLVNLQGGEIGVQSVEGSGSSFAFYVAALKAVPPNNASGNTTHAIRHALVPTGRRSGQKSPGKLDQTTILLVEDNLVNQKVLSKQLVRRGYTVYTADNGQDALDFITGSQHLTRPVQHDSGKKRPTIDVVLMDIEMPVMDGLQCTKMIRMAEGNGELDMHIPIIAVTANARPEQLKQAIDAGMDDTMSKPFHMRDLEALLKRLGL